jgi:hydroxyethylthiazole kinase
MVWQDIVKIRTQTPLVHNITNYVVMNTTANALLAIGASPVMAHALEEVQEMVGLAQSLVINIGTLSSPWVKAMIKAGKEANRRNIPVVFDPVGSGATSFRTSTALKLIQEIHPAIIRGNASEIRSLVHHGQGAKGVDSRHTPEEALDDARTLSRSAACAVSMSGQVDIIVDKDSIARIENGHPIMTKVTGMGCTASAITGAFAAVNPSAFQAAAHAMTVMGIAGEMAVERSSGTGSFQMHFIDVLSTLGESDIGQRQKVHVL